MNRQLLLCIKAQGLRLTTMVWACFFSIPFAAWLLGALPVPPPGFVSTHWVTGLALPDLRAAQWLQCLALSGVIFTFWQWFDTVKIGGWLVVKKLWTTLRVQFQGKRSALALIGFPLGAYCLASEYRWIDSLHPYAINIAWTIVLGATLHLFRPPIALALTGSHGGSGDFIDVASAALFPLRTVSLLDAKRIKRPMHMTREDNLRTFDLVDWEGTVRRLMDSVPLIVIDGRFASAVVSRELQWIGQSPTRLARAILITDDAGRIHLGVDDKEAGLLLGIRRCRLPELPVAIWNMLKPGRSMFRGLN